MARMNNTVTLTENNRLYLYELLSRELGCGKQTFITKVEEALASDAMSACDLGFASTRELLEALDGFIALKVFKGGRLYATVVSQPAWDEALASAGSGKAAPQSGKPWKKKKGAKALRPQRPKRMKREAPQPAEPALEPEKSAEAAEGADAGRQATTTTPADADRAADAAARTPGRSVFPIADDAVGATAEASGADGESHDKPPAVDEPEVSKTDSRAAGDEPAEDAPAPAFSLTVTYDPYCGFEGETKLESSPVVAANALEEEPAPAPDAAAADAAITQFQCPTKAATQTDALSQGSEAVTEASGQTAPTSQSAPAPDTDAALGPIPSAAALKGYPASFHDEVYCPAEIIGQLIEALPFGTDALCLLDADYDRARDLGLVRGTRAEAVFPLRIQRATSLEPIAITIHKRSGSGMSWAITGIDA